MNDLTVQVKNKDLNKKTINFLLFLINGPATLAAKLLQAKSLKEISDDELEKMLNVIGYYNTQEEVGKELHEEFYRKRKMTYDSNSERYIRP